MCRERGWTTWSCASISLRGVWEPCRGPSAGKRCRGYHRERWGSHPHWSTQPWNMACHHPPCCSVCICNNKNYLVRLLCPDLAYRWLNLLRQPSVFSLMSENTGERLWNCMQSSTFKVRHTRGRIDSLIPCSGSQWKCLKDQWQNSVKWLPVYQCAHWGSPIYSPSRESDSIFRQIYVY